MIPVPHSKDTFRLRLKLLRHDLFKGHYKFRFVIGIRDYTTKIVCYDATNNLLAFEVRYADSATRREFVECGRWISAIIHGGSLVECHCE